MYAKVMSDTNLGSEEMMLVIIMAFIRVLVIVASVEESCGLFFS